MKHRLHWIFNRFMAPAGDGTDAGGGGGEDRGDDFVPTDDDADDNKGTTDKSAAGADNGTAGKDAADTDDTDKGDADKGDADKGTADKDAADKDAADKDGKSDKKDRKDTRIPVSRHKEILERERAAREDAERKLAQYEGGDRIAVINDKITKAEEKIVAMDKEYTKLLTDGDHEKAAEKRREIRALENEIIEQKSDLKAQAATSRAVEKMRYDTTVERLEAAYPVLNPDHEDHDAEVAQDVIDLATTYRGRGLTPAEAIQKAAKKLLGAETRKQEDATTVKARVDEEEARAKAAKEAEEERKAKEKERRGKQVDKNVDTSRKQPPDTSKVGADNDKAGGGLTAKDVMRMSQEDFNKLSEDDLARLRGDVIA